jgi:hypothetical protein
VLTSSLFNTHLRDNLNYLKGNAGTVAFGDSITVTGLVVASEAFRFTGDGSTGQYAISGGDTFLDYNGHISFRAIDDGTNGALTLTNSRTVQIAKSTFINDTANANMTLGLTINQGAADDEALALKSSDVAHGMTDQAETDTYLLFEKHSTTSGGGAIEGYSEDVVGLRVHGVMTNGDTSKSAASQGAIMLYAAKKNGASFTSLGTNENAVVISSAGNARFIFDGDGESYQAGGTAWIDLDDHDDVGLLQTVRDAMLAVRDPLRREMAEFIRDNRERLEALKLVVFNEGADPFINMTRMTMLHNGAIRQEARKRAALERENADLRGRVERLERLLLGGVP